MKILFLHLGEETPQWFIGCPVFINGHVCIEVLMFVFCPFLWFSVLTMRRLWRQLADFSGGGQ